MIKYR